MPSPIQIVKTVLKRVHEATIDPYGGQRSSSGSSSGRFVRCGYVRHPGGTSFAGRDVTINIPKMIALFGEPDQGDGYKVSMEWIFNDTQHGGSLTLYDWRLTSLYGSGLPSPQDLRRGPVIMNIGSGGIIIDAVDDFVVFLSDNGVLDP